MVRLPIPGSDAESWGEILNDYMLQSHNPDGTLKNGAVTEQSLSTQLQTKVNTAYNGVAPVTSVAGRLGDVVVTKADVGLSNVDNTTDLGKPISTATQSALSAKANDTAVVHIAATETVTGAKTFTQPVATATPQSDAHAATKLYVDTLVATIIGGGGTATWGGITGTLSSQTDLAAVLAQKANTASLATVATSGAYADLSGLPTIPAQLNATAGTNVTITGTYPNLTFSATGGGSVSDATTSSKGIVQLAGDLGGTAAAPTVPGLAGKANTVHTHTASDVNAGTFVSARLGSGTADTTTYLRGDSTWTTLPDTTHVAISAQTAAYTLVLGDDGKAVEMNTSSAANVTVPSSASVNFPIGTVIEICQVGTGQAVLVPGGGVTLRTPSSLATKQRWSSIGLRKRATDEWVVSGDLA